MFYFIINQTYTKSLRGLLSPIYPCGIHFENYRGRTNLETIPDGRVEWVGELPFFKFWKLSLVPELYPVYFRNSLIKTDSFRTYWKWKINQTYVFVSLSSGLKLAFFKSSKNNLEIELWVLKVESCSLLLVIWAARQPNGWHDANDNARHLATLLSRQAPHILRITIPQNSFILSPLKLLGVTRCINIRICTVSLDLVSSMYPLCTNRAKFYGPSLSTVPFPLHPGPRTGLYKERSPHT